MDKLNLVPWPGMLKMDEGAITFGKKVTLQIGENEREKIVKVAETFSRDLAEQSFSPVCKEGADDSPGAVTLAIQPDKSLGQEGYRLSVKRGISITAPTEQGLFWGTRTALQLLAAGSGSRIPRLSICDKPEFAFRSFLVDVARKFHSMRFHYWMIKKLSAYKMNTYQIHFTDRESYTLPSQKYPHLPTPGRSYTRRQLQELVKFAADYNVTIIPELEMPGHSDALRTALPETRCGGKLTANHRVVCASSPKSIAVLENLIGETAEIFPGPYFHIGADEADIWDWNACPSCRAMIRRRKFKDADALYNDFINRMNRFVRSLGRKTIIWEGFHVGVKPIVDKDILVYDWEFAWAKPDELVNAGYEIINSSWSPLYVADRISMTTPEDIAGWNALRFGRGRSPLAPKYWLKIEPTNQLIGVNMCSWNNEEKAEEGLLFGTGKGFSNYGRPAPRLPIVAERAWTGAKTSPADLLERVGIKWW